MRIKINFQRGSSLLVGIRNKGVVSIMSRLVGGYSGSLGLLGVSTVVLWSVMAFCSGEVGREEEGEARSWSGWSLALITCRFRIDIRVWILRRNIPRRMERGADSPIRQEQ